MLPISFATKEAQVSLPNLFRRKNKILRLKLFKIKGMNFFTGSVLDRQSHLRGNGELLRADRNTKSKTVIFNHQLKFLSAEDGEVKWLSERELPESKRDGFLSVYLGKDLNSQSSYWAVNVGHDVEEFELIGKFGESRSSLFALEVAESAICAQAKALLDWNERYHYVIDES